MESAGIERPLRIVREDFIVNDGVWSLSLVPAPVSDLWGLFQTPSPPVDSTGPLKSRVFGTAVIQTVGFCGTLSLPCSELNT